MPATWISRLPSPLATRECGALRGVRVAIKDNIDVAGVPTTCGCPAFSQVPTAHAAVVQRLLDAGASILGKTNLDQFACGLNGTRSPYGEVENAFDPAYISGGSSSGSAVAVATGEADVALGTDTAGSGRVPAAFNNVVGLKPSPGLVSTRGVVPASRSYDCVSIFAPTVDAALDVLATIAGPDARDPLSRDVAIDSRPMAPSFRFRIPAQAQFFGDEMAQRAFSDASAALRALGGEPVAFDDAILAETASWLYESALVAERYHAIRAFFDAHERDVIEPVRAIIGAGRGRDAADLLEAQQRLALRRGELASFWDDVDCLVVPSAPTIYTRAAMRADPIALNRHLGRYTNFVNLLGWAALAVPAAFRADGLPSGITLIGPAGSDWRLAALGQRFHHATGTRLGATERPLPPPRELAAPPGPTVRLAVVGAHLSGMPLHHELADRGARLVRTTTTAPRYRLFALAGTQPPKPGLLRLADGEAGHAIEVEVWDMPTRHYGSFVAGVPGPLSIGTLALADGSQVQGFVCEAWATTGAVDISDYGGWRRYRHATSAH
ncbi:MAG TPA: allophanate hydrolase [Burkholderiaceae bacterium]|nr:allophanate hydrolase [Burkholderiaceae bacterium]